MLGPIVVVVLTSSLHKWPRRAFSTAPRDDDRPRAGEEGLGRGESLQGAGPARRRGLHVVEPVRLRRPPLEVESLWNSMKCL